MMVYGYCNSMQVSILGTNCLPVSSQVIWVTAERHCHLAGFVLVPGQARCSGSAVCSAFACWHLRHRASIDSGHTDQLAWTSFSIGPAPASWQTCDMHAARHSCTSIEADQISYQVVASKQPNQLKGCATLNNSQLLLISGWTLHSACSGHLCKYVLSLRQKQTWAST